MNDDSRLWTTHNKRKWTPKQIEHTGQFQIVRGTVSCSGVLLAFFRCTLRPFFSHQAFWRYEGYELKLGLFATLKILITRTRWSISKYIKVTIDQLDPRSCVSVTEMGLQINRFSGSLYRVLEWCYIGNLTCLFQSSKIPILTRSNNNIL